MKTLKTLHLLCLASIATLLLIAGCRSTGQRALSRGDYYKACIQAINKLRSSPDNADAANALKQSYPLLVDYANKEVARLEASPSDNTRYQQIFDQYNQLNDVAVEVSRCPAALKLLPNADYYSTQLESARVQAADETYRQAEASLSTGTRNAAKQAYLLYQQTNGYIPGYRDVAEKITRAKWEATLKVVLQQEPVGGSYKISADFFQNKVFEYFANNIRNEYIQVFSPEEATAMKLQPDQLIRLQFLDFVVGQTRETSNSKEVKKDNVKTGTYRDSQGKDHDVYGSVKATLKTRTLEVVSSGVLDAFIINPVSNTTLSQERFPGTFVWTNSWATFNGDERALSKDQLEMCKRTDPVAPPQAQDLFVEFTAPIYTSLTRWIQAYYRNY
jgi:hypothetical protein